MALTQNYVEHGNVGEEAEDEGDAVEGDEDGELAVVEDDALGRGARARGGTWGRRVHAQGRRNGQSCPGGGQTLAVLRPVVVVAGQVSREGGLQV